MLTKEPKSLDFLQASFIHSSMDENIKSNTLEIALSDFYRYKKGGSYISKLARLLFVSNPWIDVAIMTPKRKLSQNMTTITCLPKRQRNIQDQSFCKQKNRLWSDIPHCPHRGEKTNIRNYHKIKQHVLTLDSEICCTVPMLMANNYNCNK